MSINSKTKDKFKNATFKFKKSRLLKILVLSGVLLSRGKLNCDLVAEEPHNTPIENIIPDIGINITCDDSDEYLAKKLKKVLIDFENDNEITKKLVKSLEQNNIVFEVCEKSDLYAGSYMIGEDKILIPKNNLTKIFETDDKMALLRLKRAIAHETTHMLQDKNGIFKDAKQMTPIESSIIYTIAELDAICKSYVATEYDYWTPNSAFECLNNMTPSLENYTQQGFLVGKNYDDKDPRLSLQKTVAKFNDGIFENYQNTDEIIKTIKEKIRPEFMEEMVAINDEYIKDIATKQVIALFNAEKE